MQYLNKQIETMVKRKKTNSLVKKQISCSIFQDLENVDTDLKKTENKD